MCPYHRKLVLKAMRRLLRHKTRYKLICVATQLIEAGVDISFTTVYRAVAGLSSIAQAAGRCNRHDDTIKEKRKGTIIVRGMPIASRELGICGTCDIVEFISDKAGISIPSYQGTYRIIPVEYKRGKPKDGEEDILQLTLQAMCLEEMLVVTIPYGYLYYGETKHRCKVVFEKYYRKHEAFS